MPSSPAAVRGPLLRVVSVNDVYSLENLPRLATLIRHCKETDPADAFIAVLAGDFVAPSMLSSLDQGKGMVECLNAVGITHVIFGNHEDDIPMAALHKRIREFRGTWLSTNLRGFDAALSPFQVLEVGMPGGRTVRVGLVGVVMTDPAIYRRPPFGGSPLDPANESVLREAARLRAEERCDVVIPITHQELGDDRALISDSSSAPFPLILGVHEHDVHVERDLGTWLVKVGSDAVRAAIVDVEWAAKSASRDTTKTEVPTVAVHVVPVAEYPEDTAVRSLVDGLMKRVEELEGAVLVPLAPGEELSSVGARARQVTMGTMVCSRVRDALRAEVCLINGGGIRGNRDYTAHLAFGDIKAELPFDNEMVVVEIPGLVIRDAIAASRSLAPVESGGFLQVDDQVTLQPASGSNAAEVTKLHGEPLDLARDYKVATVRAFFTGMDHIAPLIAFAREHPERIPAATTSRELKEVLLEALALALWHKLGAFDALDTNKDEHVSESELAEGIERLLGEPASPLTVTLVMNVVDKDHDHRISREESDLAERNRVAHG